RAADGPHRARPDAELLDGLDRLRLQPGMRRQPQVVVRRQVDDGLAVEGCGTGLLAVAHAQLPVQPLVLQRLQFVGEIGERLVAHGTDQSTVHHPPVLLLPSSSSRPPPPVLLLPSSSSRPPLLPSSAPTPPFLRSSPPPLLVVP